MINVASNERYPNFNLTNFHGYKKIKMFYIIWLKDKMFPNKMFPDKMLYNLNFCLFFGRNILNKKSRQYGEEEIIFLSSRMYKNLYQINPKKSLNCKISKSVAPCALFNTDPWKPLGYYSNQMLHIFKLIQQRLLNCIFRRNI